MALPRKNVSQAPVAASAAVPTLSKEKGKVVEITEPMSHHPNLSYIHITDAEDSQSTSTQPQRTLTAMLEPLDTNFSRHFSA